MYDYYLQTAEDVVKIPVRFATDGAKMAKKKDSVRGVIKILCPRDTENIQMHGCKESPHNENTIYLFMGKCVLMYARF